jgi:peptidoglycan/LPS O-acetylase OafA/YrhL
MSTTFSPTSTVTQAQAVETAARPTFWKAGVVSGIAAAVATTLIAVAARAADVSLAVDGEKIPLLGFAQLTLVGALIGTVMARVMSRRARQPRRTFVVTTVVLTALSLVPDVTVDAPTSSKLVLMLTHVVAAAIVVPALANRLSTQR